MHTRRQFLTTATLATASRGLLARAEERRQSHNLPDGIINPYDWGTRKIPASGADSPRTDAIDKAITDAMREHGIVGCGIAVVRGARIGYAKGFGYSELPNTPFLPTTASRCGSLSKSITGLCALVLLDQGKLNLDAVILPILKEVGIVPKPVGGANLDERISKITVRHLMDHTSGLPSGTTYTAWRAERNVSALHNLEHIATGADIACDALGQVRLDFEPGKGFQYANANFVLLARVIEAKSGLAFNDYLTRIAMPKFGLRSEEIYVSKNQTGPTSSSRGDNEAAYYQVSRELFLSFVNSEEEKGQIYGEAYRGFASESSDGGGGIAGTAIGFAKIIANLNSENPALSQKALRELLTPPTYYATKPDFDPAKSNFYSKGFDIRFSGGRPWFSHGGMTLHCGGIIGHNAGYQFVGVSNWNASKPPFVDEILDHALGVALSKM